MPKKRPWPYKSHGTPIHQLVPPALLQELDKPKGSYKWGPCFP